MHIKTPRYRVQCLVFTASHTLADWIGLASPNTPWAISTSVCFRALRFPPRQTSTTWKRLKYAQPACSGSWWQCWQFALASYSSTACHYPACCHYALLLTFSKVIIKPEQIVAQIIIIVQIVPQIIIIIQIASKTCTAHIHLSGAELPLSHICVAQNNMLLAVFGGIFVKATCLSPFGGALNMTSSLGTTSTLFWSCICFWKSNNIGKPCKIWLAASWAPNLTPVAGYHWSLTTWPGTGT